MKIIMFFLFNFYLKHTQLCANIWRCFSDDDNDEYNEDENDIVEQIQQLRRQLDQSREESERQRDAHSSSNEQLRISLGKFIDILVSNFK
jgi:hypothetical protein